MSVAPMSEGTAGSPHRQPPANWPDPASPGADDDLPMALGETLSGRYVLEGILGTGGMGIVCRARHVELEQPVAVKFLRKRFAHEPTVAARFLEEARAAAALRSEHVARVMDVGQTPSGVPYYVMEHLDGTDLESLLVREGPLRIVRALDYVRQACAALHEAHALGIVHRDVKPENLFLATRGEEKPVLKVVDFGIAKRLDPARAKVVTGPQDHLGSPCYMSPEQMWTPRSVDTRTDVWSLGVVLYQLLTGALPFDGESVSEVFSRVASAEFTPVSVLRPDVDPYLDAIVRRCLEKSLDLRYPSVDALADDLDRYEKTVLSATDPSLRFTTPVVRMQSDAPVSASIHAAALPLTRTPWGLVMLPALALTGILVVAEGGLFSLRPTTDAVALERPGATETGVRIVAPFGVIVADPSGATELPAEPERSHEGSRRDPAAHSGPALTETDRRERSYGRYLRRHGWRPLKEVLEEMNQKE